MPPFVGTQVHFTDGTAAISVSAEDGTIETQGGWVVVTTDDGKTVQEFPARIVHDVLTKS